MRSFRARNLRNTRSISRRELTGHVVDAQHDESAGESRAGFSRGRRTSMNYAFVVHQLGHAHRELTVGAAIDPDTLPENLRQHFLRREERKKAQKAAG